MGSSWNELRITFVNGIRCIYLGRDLKVQRESRLLPNLQRGFSLVDSSAKLFSPCSYSFASALFERPHLMTTLGLIVGDFEGLLCRSLPVLGRPWMKQAICWLSEDAPTFEMNTQETTAESLFACPCKGRCYPAAFNPDVRFWQRISRLTQSVQLTHAFNIRQGSLSVCLYPTRESRVKVSLTRLILGWCSENPTLGCHCLEQPVLDQRS